MPPRARAGATGDVYGADATASTLNYALGSRHMKSWMTGAANAAPAAPSDFTPNPAPNPGRKRGRPRKHPQSDAVNQQHATELARSSNAPSAEGLPPSNSASPQLANIVTTYRQNTSRGHAEVTVFPSPTPSEDDVRSGEDHNNARGTKQTVNINAFDSPPLQFPNASSPPRPTTARSPARQAPDSPARQTHASPPLSAQQFGVLPNVPQAAQPHHVLVSQPRAPHYDYCYSFDTCMQTLDTFEMNTLTTARVPDQVRLQALEEAVKGQDWAYLTLHQYYCLMTCSLQSLPLYLQHNGNLDAAYSLIMKVLGDNSQLTPLFLRFFCDFPFPVNHIALKWPTMYQLATSNFVEFVNHSANVEALRQACKRRGAPPTPREFADSAITSLTFRRLFFRSIILVLWRRFPDGAGKDVFGNSAFQAFNQAQVSFNQRSSTGQLGGRQQAEEELRIWVFNFTKITSSFVAELRRQGFLPINSASPAIHQQQQPRRRQQQQPQSYNSPYNTPVIGDMTMSRPPQQLPPQTTHSRTASQAQPSPRPRQGSTALLPRPGLRQPPQRIPNPSRFGLHQAHLRSPVLQASDLSSPAYYFWQGFFRRPQMVTNPNNAIEKLSFPLSKQEMESIAKAVPTAPGAADGRAIDENHKMVRLRCVKWPSNEEPKDDAWAVAETSWIPHSYFTFNEVPLQLRKKLHNGKDLPVDLTGLARMGPNILEVSVMSNAADITHRSYLVAIEFLGIMTEASTKERCHKNGIPAKKTIEDIKRRLSSSAADDDDDDGILLVESTLTINLRDPFSASKICDTPVRGTACLHHECFDLDTFLETRTRKGDVSAADQWRCPICKADARPNVLVVDEFLVEVRNELEKKGLLETRAIIVEQDGSWKPKPEGRDPNGVQDRDTPERTPTALQSAARSRPPVQEIIDLDSD